MNDLVSVQTDRFGEIKVPAGEVLTFPEGLLGFADRKRFVIVQEASYEPFLWLQSADDPNLCFVVVDPTTFMEDYRVEIKPSEIESIELGSVDEAQVLVIVVVREDPEDITANLQGPLVVNPKKGLGKQVVLLTDRYHTRHYILREAGAPASGSGPGEKAG